MRIVIDYTSAVHQGAGIGRYTRGLVSALAQTDKSNLYTLFCAGCRNVGAGLAPAQGDHTGEVPPFAEGGSPLLWPSTFRLQTSRMPARWLMIGWHRLHLPVPAETLVGGCDIFHSPDFTLPPLAAARGVVTVHDLSFLRMPQCADPGLARFLAKVVPRAVSRAIRVLADSQSTARDLTELMGVPAEKISVVGVGVEPRFQPVRDPGILAAVRARYRLPPRFILSLGTLEPRKNFQGLVSAYAQMRRKTGLPHQLVIAGKPGWLYKDLFDRVAREGLGEHVHFPGYIVDADLPALYSLADIFAFPSLYEGFGLPPLEAMACGVPVVASDNSSLPESVGTAALTVKAEDVDGLADAMALVLGDAALGLRLSDLGRAQAARFTWRGASLQLLDAYRRTMEL